MDGDTWQAAQLGWGIIQSLFTAGVWVYAWASQRDRARQGELEALKTAHDVRLRENELAITQLKARVEYLPNGDDLSALNAAIAGLTAQVRGTHDTIDAVDRRTSRIEDWLSTTRRTL